MTATQLNHESVSLGPDYDEEQSVVYVKTKSDLNKGHIIIAEG